MKKKALIVGSAIVDQMMLIDKLPKSGDDIPCKEIHTVIGGCAYNVASTLSNMEVEHDLCVPVGTGMYADLVKQELTAKGYPILLNNPALDNGYCLSLVENGGERTFITVSGAESIFKEEWLVDMDMEPYDRIYLAGYQAAGDSGRILAKWLAANQDKELFFAPGPMITVIEEDIMDTLFSLRPILHINDKEARDYTGEAEINAALSRLYEKTGNTVIVTLGAEGTAYYDGTKFITIPTEKAEVVDTVGAGDSHVAAIIGGLSQGKSLDDAVAYANIIAGGIVGVQGPTMTKEQYKEYIGGIK